LSRPAPAGPKKASGPAPENKDSFREVIETIVFVVVLVLLLKTFLAEAFVIPTGSMATTLLGYHRVVVCEKCGFQFLVNASKEADPQEGPQQPVVSCTCPNCEFSNQILHPFGGGPR
jgi:Signal peptidase, peptidase S26